MDIVGFIVFSLNRQYILRWVGAGLVLLVPILNFFSLGYLSKVSHLLLTGGAGLPAWEDKTDVFRLGAYLLYIMVLFFAVPSFLFSCWFLLVSFGNFFAAFMGGVMKLLAGLAFVGSSFFIPFAFCSFSESMDLPKAFDFQGIAAAIKEVWVPYLFGYLVSTVLVYLTLKVHRIPYVGFLLSSALTYYVLLLSTCYFTQLFRRTSLHSGRGGAV
jgi:hypothetical protein